MRIVGVVGVAGSGKDEAALGLCQMMNFERVALADPMKRFVMELFPAWNEMDLFGPSQRRNAPSKRYGGLSPRVALQQLGTEWGRRCYEPVWVEKMLRAARSLLHDGEIYAWYDRCQGVRHGWRRGGRPYGVVVPDVRFADEVHAIQNEGGLVIRITRPGAGLTGAAAQHASEAEQLGIPDEDFDAVVVNDGTIAQLHERVCLVVQNLLTEAA